MPKKMGINELGEKNSREKYICRTCKREVLQEDARKEKWYYYINKKEGISSQNMQYFDFNDVEYVCNEHYKTLSEEESPKFVEIGYPYYPSLLINNQNITTF